MRIGIQTWGSEGDVRPLLALGAGLRRAGHEVTVAVGSLDGRDYRGLCRQLGLFFLAAPEHVPFDFRGFLASLPGDSTMQWFSRLLSEAFYPQLGDLHRAAERLCAGNELVIGHTSVFPLKAAAQAAGLPFVSVSLCPASIPTEHWPPGGAPDRGRGGNALAWQRAYDQCDAQLRPEIERFWQRLGLPSAPRALDAGRSELLNLVAASPVLCPPAPDWGCHHRVCGSLDLPPSPPLLVSAEIERFLAAGEPPVFITFGSVQDHAPAAMLELQVEAARLAGCRAVIQIPPAQQRATGLQPGHNLLLVDRTPHEQVFPRCAAVVHHAGAGTSHTALRAGCPAVPVALQDEEWYWGTLLQRLGVATAPLRYPEIRAEHLAAAIRTVLAAPRLRRRAQQLGESLRREDGVAQAVEWIEELIPAAGNPEVARLPAAVAACT